MPQAHQQAEVVLNGMKPQPMDKVQNSAHDL
jgi:hypothetical protein